MPKSPTNALCELRHLGGCGGPLEGAHVINKSALRNVRGALAYCEKNSEILIASICHNHNTGRDHDTKQNTAAILKVRCSIFGVEYVSGVLEGLRLLSKSRPPEWRLSALLSAEEPLRLLQETAGRTLPAVSNLSMQFHAEVLAAQDARGRHQS